MYFDFVVFDFVVVAVDDVVVLMSNYDYLLIDIYVYIYFEIDVSSHSSMKIVFYKLVNFVYFQFELMFLIEFQ